MKKNSLLPLVILLALYSVNAMAQAMAVPEPVWTPPHYTQRTSQEFATLECGGKVSRPRTCDGSNQDCGCYQWVIFWRGPGMNFGYGLSYMEGSVVDSVAAPTQEEVIKKKDSRIKFEKSYAKFFDIPFDQNYANPSEPYCDVCDPNAPNPNLHAAPSQPEADLQKIRNNFPSFVDQGRGDDEEPEASPRPTPTPDPDFKKIMGEVKRQSDAATRASSVGVSNPASNQPPIKKYDPAKAEAAAKKALQKFQQLPPKYRDGILNATPQAAATPRPKPTPAPKDPKMAGVEKLGRWAGPSHAGSSYTQWVTVPRSGVISIHREFDGDNQHLECTIPLAQLDTDMMYVGKGYPGYNVHIELKDRAKLTCYRDGVREPGTDWTIEFSSKEEAENAKASILQYMNESRGY